MKTVTVKSVVRSLASGSLSLELDARPAEIGRDELARSLLEIVRERFPGPDAEGGGVKHVRLTSMVSQADGWRVAFTVRAKYGGAERNKPRWTCQITVKAILAADLRPERWDVSYRHHDGH